MCVFSHNVLDLRATGDKMNTFEHEGGSVVEHSVKRREVLLQYMRQKSFATVSDLAARLKCSQMTIRRDLTRLEKEGVLQRSHGGAVISRRIKLEFALAEKAERSRRQKVAIGHAAVDLVEPGERILIGTGTTMLAMAHELGSCEDLSVVTTSLAIASALLSVPGVECMLVGGTLRENSPDLYGPLLEENLSRMHADCAFIGADGVSAKGVLMAIDPRVGRVTSLMLRSSRRVVLLVDSSKAYQNSFIAFGAFDQLDYLITDNGMPVDILDAARDAGVKIIIAKPGK